MNIKQAGASDFPGALEIFWETAAQTEFSSPEDRKEFVFKYFGYYRAHADTIFLVAKDDGGVCGYICGVADTQAHPDLFPVSAHLPLFDDLYDDYPAHLHINVHARTRGQGVGARLLGAFSDAAAAEGAVGVHLVTSVGARNAAFYLRNGFTTTVERALPGAEGAPLLFMAKPL